MSRSALIRAPCHIQPLLAFLRNLEESIASLPNCYQLLLSILKDNNMTGHSVYIPWSTEYYSIATAIKNNNNNHRATLCKDHEFLVRFKTGMSCNSVESRNHIAYHNWTRPMTGNDTRENSKTIIQVQFPWSLSMHLPFFFPL